MKHSILIILTLFFVFHAGAQETGSFRAVNSANLISVGRRSVYDTYLSPYVYKGLDIGFMNEQIRLSRKYKSISYQNTFRINVSSTENHVGNSDMWAAMLSYRWGAHYRTEVLPGLKVMGGALIGGSLGGLYHLRNTNNPGQGKLNAGLSLSGMVTYNTRVWNQPLYIRYQINMAAAGVTFSPHYGQSYYEIFYLGNTKNTFLFSSFHNMIEMENLLTVDIPLKHITLRTGYSNVFMKSKLHKLDTQINTHSFLIGIVKEGLFFRGTGKNKPTGYQSPLY